MMASEDFARVTPLTHRHGIPNRTSHFDQPLPAVEEALYALT
jgi:hypothetical protein